MHRITTDLFNGVDWLARSKRGRRLAYGGIIAVSIGSCLASGVWPNDRFTPGWQPAVAKIVPGGTDILLNGKVLGFLKGKFGLPPTIWIELTKKADYYEAQRPINGHGLLVTPLVITAICGVVLVVLLMAVLARHRRRYGASEQLVEPRNSAELLQFGEFYQRSMLAAAQRSEPRRRWRRLLKVRRKLPTDQPAFRAFPKKSSRVLNVRFRVFSTLDLSF